MNKADHELNKRHLVLTFNIHQPHRLVKQQESGSFIDKEHEQQAMQRIARQCYLPVNNLLLKLINQYPDIKIAFAISGTAIDQMEEYAPEVLKSFRELADTGCVDFLSTPYYHSVAGILEPDEFENQILHHVAKLVEHFNIRPAVFRNAGLIFNDEIASRVSKIGLTGMLTESSGQNETTLYNHPGSALKVLLRHRGLSDDIAFRTGDSYHNVTAQKFLSWMDALPEDEPVVVLNLDYETFGEHYKSDSQIFHFLESLLLLVAIQRSWTMLTPSEAIQNLNSEHVLAGSLNLAMEGSSISDLQHNEKQRALLNALIELNNPLKAHNDPSLLHLWRSLMAVENFHFLTDHADHGSWSPYKSSQEAFDTFMNIINYLRSKVSADNSTPDKVNELHESERRTMSAPVWALKYESSGHP